VVADPNVAVDRLADEFWEGYLERHPMTATLLGDERYDDRLPDLGPEGRAADEAAFRAVLAGAEEIGDDGLDPEATITRDMLVLVAENHLQFFAQRQYQIGVDHIFGPQTTPAEIARYQRADTPERLERMLRRYAAYPRMVNEYIGTLGEGIADGRTSAEVPVQRAIEQIGRMLETPSAESPSVALAGVPDGAARERIREAVERHVYPALRTLHAYLVDSYAPQARREPALSATPGGEDAYRLAIRMSTTVAATPDEVHRFGLEDLERIEAEKDDIARRLGHGDRHALVDALAADADNRTDQPQRLVELAKAQTARAFAAAPTFFARLPREDCIVLAVEAYREREAPPAFYMPPALDGSRPGQYYINTYQPQERQLHNLAAITFHEATPGHHFQLAIEQELEGLPAFRRLGSRLAGVAYVEGWGLYCERLADEMGLYLDERERFGMLNAQSFRAARLVVDSGLHAMGWTRERAIDFMHRRGSLPMVDAAIEVDRYTIWPGQALSYKIGQREIERAREEVASRMGKRFDLRIFHDQVLAHGSVPLETLRREIPGWVEGVAAAPA
jgi:uncharacterized protein (DUF885 family)